MNRQDILGATLTVVTLAFLSSMGALAYYVSAPEAHDAETLCPIDRAVPHTAMLVDRTDPFTKEHTTLFVSAVKRATEALRDHERLSLFLIEGSAPKTPTPILSICKPPDGSGANWLYENKTLLRAQYEERFTAPLSALVERLARSESAPTSPIMEMVRSVAALPEFSSAVRERKLIIVSDLLQNVRGYSHYRSKPIYEEFRSSRYASSVRPDLVGAEVELVYLPNKRARANGTAEHRAFWRQYFAAAGASVVHVITRNAL